MTGGSGDLGMSLAPRLLSAGCSVTSLDPLPSSATEITSVQGSILDRPLLDELMARADVVIHIAAWHGFHAFTKSKNDADFWDLNMTGTFNVLDACTRAKVTKCIFISSSSVDEWPEMYGTTKLLGEELCRSYVARAPMQILALRPRAFIPWWNTAVYNTIDEWAEWFIRGAVHIDDVAEACILGYNLLSDKTGAFFNNITLDGKRDLSDIELAQWRTRGGKEILATHFPRYRDLIMNGTFIPAEPPTYKGNSKAREILGYEPRYGLGEMLEELERLHSVKAA
jgi:nucleoside-diphosphate-sugar epimerase